MKITLEKYCATDVQREYLQMFEMVFGIPDYLQIPAFVYLVFGDGEVLAFMAGYLMNLETFYISYGGMMPNRRAGKNILLSTKEAMRELHCEFKKIMCLVENNNNPMIKVLLTCGFQMVGFRQIERKGYVELLKKRGN